MQYTQSKYKKKKYIWVMVFMLIGNILLGVTGYTMASQYESGTDSAWIGVICLILSIIMFLPCFILLVRGISLAGTQQMYNINGNMIYYTWEADSGSVMARAKHYYYKLEKVLSYKETLFSIKIKVEALYTMESKPRKALLDWEADRDTSLEYAGAAILDDLFTKKAVRKKKKITIKKTFENEQLLISDLLRLQS